MFSNGTLIIENVERNSDQATYTCVAKNAEGYSARGALEVQVMGKQMFQLFLTGKKCRVLNSREISLEYVTEYPNKTCK